MSIYKGLSRYELVSSITDYLIENINEEQNIVRDALRIYFDGFYNDELAETYDHFMGDDDEN